MKNVQKLGGIAALYLAAAYLVGISIFLVVLDYLNISDPAQKVALVVEKQTVMYITNLLMYVLFGFFLITLVVALYERLKTSAPMLIRGATAVGLIWAGALIVSGMVANAGIAPVAALFATDPAQAAVTWLTIETVASGFSGGNGEILGGMFSLLISFAGLQANGLPRGLNYLGILVGAVGIISTIPGLSDLTGLFGIIQIVWFVWLGLVLLRRSPAAA